MNSPFQTDDEQLAEKVMAGAGMVLEALTALRTLIHEDRQLGPRDETMFCGFLAAAIKREGGRLNNGPHALRHAVEPQPGDPQDPGAHIAAHRLLFELLACLRRGPGEDALLDRTIAIWPQCRSYDEAQNKMQALDDLIAQASRHAERAAHEARLSVQKVEAAVPSAPQLGPAPTLKPRFVPPPPGQSFAGPSPRTEAVPRPPAAVRPRAEWSSGPGVEWTEGDNLETNVPTVG